MTTVKPGSPFVQTRLPIWRQLRWRLVVFFIVLAVVPLTLIALVNDQATRAQAQQQAFSQLESVADLKVKEIDQYLDEGDKAVDLLLADAERRQTLYLLATSEGGNQAAQKEVNLLFREATVAHPLLKSLNFYTADGVIVASSRPERIGQNVSRAEFFENSLLVEDIIHPPLFDLAENELEVTMTDQIQGADEKAVGIVQTEFNAEVLSDLMISRAGLGSTGETYLVSSQSNFLLTPSRKENYAMLRPYDSQGIRSALQHSNGGAIYDNYESPPVRVVGVYRWIPDLQAALLAEISYSEVENAATTARTSNLQAGTLFALLAGVVGLLVAATTTTPIIDLTEVAADMASGNLQRRVNIRSRTEIGALGTAFNTMADQVETLVGTLEVRVRARTRDLQIAADVARQISSALTLQELLDRVVELTKTGFNLYHAHVYLLDPEGETLVMEAGAGEAGRIMKEVGHSIPMDAERSLVAQAARTAEPVIVNDVQAEPHHLPNPLLPETRAELAVPMRLGEITIGVLDVQSATVNRFSEEDAKVIGTLADQVAVAVQNARLFEQTGRSERLLRAVIDASTDWIWAKDRDLNWTLVNEPYANQLLGVEPDQAVGRSNADFFPQELVEAFQADDYAALGGQTIHKLDDVVQLKDGSQRIIDTVESPLYDAEGNITGVLGVARDVTDQIRATRRQQTAYQLGERLTAVLDVDTLLKETINRLSESFFYYHAHIYLVDDQGDMLLVKEGLGAAGEMLKSLGHAIPMDAERSLVAQAARTRQPVIRNDVQAAPDHLPNPLLPETRSEVALPLFTGDNVLGVLDAQQNSVNYFDENEVQTLQIIANQLAVSLSNARLFEEAQTALAETAALYAASEAISRAATIQDVLRSLVMSSPLGDFDRATIALFDRPWTHEQKASTQTIVAAWEHSGSEPRSSVGTTYDIDRTPGMALLSRETSTIFDNLQADERLDEETRALFERLNINSLVLFPLVVGDEWIGIVTGQNTESIVLEEKQIRLLETLAGQAASITQNLRLYQEVQSSLLQTRSSQQLLRSVIDTTPDWIWVKDDHHRFVTVNRAIADNYGLTQEQMIGRTDYDLGIPMDLIEGDPERGIEGIRRDDELALSGEVVHRMNEIALDRNGNAITLETNRFPLYNAQGSIIGTVGISTDVTERRRQERRERLAYELGQELAILYSPELLMRETIRHLHEAMGYYHAHIYALNEPMALLELKEGLGEAGALLKEMGHTIPVDAERSLVARAARRLEPVVVNDVSLSPDHLPNPLLPETLSEVALPLYSGQRLMGVLDVQHNIVDYFSEAEVRTLRVVANQLAIAISNAELYQEQLQNADRLRELDRLKSEFLANMSHELRTPLNSIIGYSELLIDEVGPSMDEMSFEDLKAVHSSGQHLLAIINDILDLAKIEAGRLELNRTKVNLSSVAEPLAESARVLLKEKPDVELLLDIPVGLPQIEADTIRLRQILWNLLSNATKFTEHGYVRLSAVVDGDELCIAVEDTGPGIEPRFHSIIFDQFRQADGSATRKAGGTGLGLAITRQLVMLHGGRIWVDSTMGEGSTFSFTLPLNRAAEPASPVPGD